MEASMAISAHRRPAPAGTKRLATAITGHNKRLRRRGACTAPNPSTRGLHMTQYRCPRDYIEKIIIGCPCWAPTGTLWGYWTSGKASVVRVTATHLIARRVVARPRTNHLFHGTRKLLCRISGAVGYQFSSCTAGASSEPRPSASERQKWSRTQSLRPGSVRSQCRKP